jgi:hypothetical protein
MIGYSSSSEQHLLHGQSRCKYTSTRKRKRLRRPSIPGPEGPISYHTQQSPSIRTREKHIRSSKIHTTVPTYSNDPHQRETYNISSDPHPATTTPPKCPSQPTRSSSTPVTGTPRPVPTPSPNGWSNTPASKSTAALGRTTPIPTNGTRPTSLCKKATAADTRARTKPTPSWERFMVFSLAGTSMSRHFCFVGEFDSSSDCVYVLPMLMFPMQGRRRWLDDVRACEDFCCV